jgi:hypothetical protein
MDTDTQRIPVISDVLEHWFPVDPDADTEPINAVIDQPANGPMSDNAMDDRDDAVVTVTIPVPLPRQPRVAHTPPPRVLMQKVLDGLRRLRTHATPTPSTREGSHHDVPDGRGLITDATSADTADELVAGLALECPAE